MPLALHTGLRRGELLGLRWKDIDFQAGMLRVVQTIPAVYGRPHPQQRTKSGAGRTLDRCPEEDEITLGKPGLVRERQEQTTRSARYYLRQFPLTRWCWVPTVQGWSIEDYRHHATQLRPLVRRMARHYGEASPFRVGIGTLCRRASPTMIHQVVKMVSEILPGYPLHLWGVKRTLLQHSTTLPASVVSIDYAAWNGRFGTGIEQYRQSGLSQREYAYTVALPAYLAKVETALLRT